MFYPDQKLVFIGGLHRSGTSLLHAMLREHPSVSGFHNTGVPEDEGQHLQTVYQAAYRYGGPGKFCFDPNAWLGETSPLVSDDTRKALLNDWGKYWDINCSVLLEKSPPNLIRTRFLQALFPEAYFIIVVRHPAIVSLATQKWSDTSINSLLSHWQTAHNIFLNDKPHLHRVVIIRYEDLIRKKEKTLEKLCNFLGITPYQSTEELSAKVDEKYIIKWKNFQLRHPIRSRLAWRRTSLAAQFDYQWNAPYLKQN